MPVLYLSSAWLCRPVLYLCTFDSLGGPNWELPQQFATVIVSLSNMTAADFSHDINPAALERAQSWYDPTVLISRQEQSCMCERHRALATRRQGREFIKEAIIGDLGVVSDIVAQYLDDGSLFVTIERPTLKQTDYVTCCFFVLMCILSLLVNNGLPTPGIILLCRVHLSLLLLVLDATSASAVHARSRTFAWELGRALWAMKNEGDACVCVDC